MPKYLVRVAAEYHGEIAYEVEADTPERAREIAASGEVEAIFEEHECSSCEWETADVRLVDDNDNES